MHHGQQNHPCQDGGRQLVTCLEPYCLSDDPRALMERLLVDRSSWRGIGRAVGVSLQWRLGFLLTCCAA